MLEKVFKLKSNNTSAKTEVIAGLTTFMTMACRKQNKKVTVFMKKTAA